jgi:hypothetical protein
LLGIREALMNSTTTHGGSWSLVGPKRILTTHLVLAALFGAFAIKAGGFGLNPWSWVFAGIVSVFLLAAGLRTYQNQDKLTEFGVRMIGVLLWTIFLLFLLVITLAKQIPH